LLFQLRHGSVEDAWATFVRTYAPVVYRYCRRCGLQDADAEEVTQHVLFQARRCRYDSERGRFRDWLGTVTRNAVRRHLRPANQRKRGQGGEAFAQVANGIAAPENDVAWDRLYQVRLLEAALERIRPEFPAEKWRAFMAVGLCQEVTPDGLRWAVAEQVDAAPIAAELGRPVGWIYKAKCQVLKRLREEICYLAEEIGLLR
jgi:RNA polymerase sigma-70 factor (ECF subfamily)